MSNESKSRLLMTYLWLANGTGTAGIISGSWVLVSAGILGMLLSVPFDSWLDKHLK